MEHARELVNLLSDALLKDLLFVAYSMPGSNEIEIICQTQPEIEDNFTGEDGFVMAPFEPSGEKIWIKADRYIQKEGIYTAQLPSVEYSRKFEASKIEATTHSTYSSELSHLIDFMKTGELSKIVFSRTKDFVPEKKLETVFLDLNVSNPEAFVYLVNLPGRITWIGASPELLISNEHGKCQTMALAATKTNEEAERPWNKKEKAEQAYVSNYIETILKKHAIDYFRSELREKKLNSGIMHLCTDFSFSLIKENSFWTLVSDLHPTPAVCGIPLDLSMKTILDKESHNRAFYTGYLGPVIKEKGRYLYVNLRCARFVEGNGTVFVGGGITAESDVESEWNETELKARTMLKSALEKNEMKEYIK